MNGTRISLRISEVSHLRSLGLKVGSVDTQLCSCDSNENNRFSYHRDQMAALEHQKQGEHHYQFNIRNRGMERIK